MFCLECLSPPCKPVRQLVKDLSLLLRCFCAGEAPSTPEGYRGSKTSRPPKETSLADAGIPSLNERPRKTAARFGDDNNDAAFDAVSTPLDFGPGPAGLSIPKSTVAVAAKTATRVKVVAPWPLPSWKGNSFPPSMPELVCYALMWLQTVARCSPPVWQKLVRLKARNKEELKLDQMSKIQIPH